MEQYLCGPKTKLVKFSEQYITASYIGWLNDHQVNRYLNTGRLPVVRGNITIPDGEKNLMFAILSNVEADYKGQLSQDTDFNYYIGTCSLHDIDWIARKGEVGYMIGNKHYWNCGIATEIIGLISDYAFGRLNLNKLTAGVVEENLGSSKALEKNGYKQYAINEQDYYLEGKMLNARRFHKFQSWHYKEQSV